MTTLTLLTGASRGRGRARAARRRPPGHPGRPRVLTSPRRPAPPRAALAHARGATLEQWSADLAAPGDVDGLLGAWLSDLGSRDPAQRPARVRLVHNAALLTDPGPVKDVAPGDLSDALRVGLEAPVLLTATFLRHTRGWGADRRILFISSGLGRRAMAGSAPYCAVKAGLDHFARALALDEAQAGDGGAKVVSLAPGVIDTDMQATLRGADRAQFPEGARFAQLKSSGALDTPDEAAAKVLRYLDRDDFGRTVVADVREA